VNNTGKQPVPFGLFIGGEFVEAAGPPTLPVMNPATGETWATIADAQAKDVDRAVRTAQDTFTMTWSKFSPRRRAELLNRLADVIEKRATELAEVEVRDNGKLLREMLAQLKSVPAWYRYFAGLADKIHGETIPMEQPSLFNYTLREPLGVVACVTPWNSPLLLGSWKFAPALAAGNVIVVKPSEHASISTLEFARCFEVAGVPAGVFNVVTGRGAHAGEALVRHPCVRHIAFTGSGAGGAAVASAGGSRSTGVTL
jgi:(Z)-2-((N-methylformamido)methylene)-5-hydroxybutyrolactone dehydrogenase